MLPPSTGYPPRVPFHYHSGSTMLTEQNAREVIGTTAYGADGDKLGKVGQLFLDDQTGRPEFVTVNTGLFGTNETFIPVSDASFDGDRLTLPFDKAKIKDAPNVDADGGHLDQSEEQRLYEYYGMSYDKGTYTETNTYTGTDTVTDTNTVTDSGTRSGTVTDTDRDRDVYAGTDTTGVRSEGHDTSGPTTDNAMTRSEESLQVGKTQQETGRVRLRKYVTTEQETHTVPVRKEKAVLESEPITDANVGEATSGPDLSDE
jgi:sporulation protein YlmC with PRC-barrel domain